MSQYAAVLWVPDPEQRHGWREYYVRHGPQPKPKPGDVPWSPWKRA
jgi:hypothetical protein